MEHKTSDERRREEDGVDRIPESWRDANFRLDKDRRTLPKSEVRPYREWRVRKATRAQAAKQNPLFRMPQQAYMKRLLRSTPGVFMQDSAGRAYTPIMDKFPSGDADEAFAFYSTTRYAPNQLLLYVVLLDPLDEFPREPYLALSNGKTYKVVTTDFEPNRSVGVAVVTETHMNSIKQPS